MPEARGELGACSKLGLGTVQFGLDYGISNQQHHPDLAEVRAILKQAHDRGVRSIDTALLYGKSETVLGHALPRPHQFEIVTKTGSLSSDADAAGEVKRGFAKSLENLQETSVHGLLVHHANDLLGSHGEAIFDAMLLLKQHGQVSKIGVSVYGPSQIYRILERFPIDIVQVPVNVLDQRFVRSDCLCRLKGAGVEVHARSVFLQGVLLMQPSELPDTFNPIQGRLAAASALCKEHGLTPMQLALGFVHSLPEVDRVLVGTNRSSELLGILSALDELAAKRVAWNSLSSALASLACDDERIINPSLWAKKAG